MSETPVGIRGAKQTRHIRCQSSKHSVSTNAWCGAGWRQDIGNTRIDPLTSKAPPTIAAQGEASMWLWQGTARPGQAAGSCPLCGQQGSHLEASSPGRRVQGPSPSPCPARVGRCGHAWSSNSSWRGGPCPPALLPLEWGTGRAGDVGSAACLTGCGGRVLAPKKPALPAPG